MPPKGVKSPGSGGRATPTKILQARGSWRAKVRDTTEPQPVAGIPDCPTALEGVAARTWDDMCQQLAPIGVLTTIDGKALARYCEAWAVWVALQQETGPDPEYRRVEKMMKLSEHLLRFEIQYGLTPASRPNIHRVDTPPHGNSRAHAAHQKKDKSRFFVVE